MNYTTDSSTNNIDYSNGYFEELKKTMSNNQHSSNGGGSVNPPKGLFEPDEKYYRRNLDARGIREKFYHLTFRVLREIAGKVAPITSVHTLRTMQVRPFSFKSYNDEETGFRVKLRNKKATPSSKEKKEMEEIEDFFLHSGYLDFPGFEDRKEGMQDINEQLVREILTIDQYAFSLRRNRRGQLLDYFILDGSTVKRTIKDHGFEGDSSIKFVQEVEGHIVETFTDKDIIFGYTNMRTDITKKGYGYSFIEQSVDIITAWLWGMGYNKEFFNTSAQPKGILTFEGGNLDTGQIEDLQRQWVAMFRGIKGLWKTPFLQYNAKWQNLAPSNRDMEFNEYIQVLSSWIFAIHGTDAQEVGMRLNQANNVMNDSPDKKAAFSKSRALRDLLMSVSTVYNKIMIQVPEWRKYTFNFVGLESKDQAAETDIDNKQVKTYITFNEKRKEKDLPPIKGGDIIADPQYVQNLQVMETTEREQSAESNSGIENEGGEEDDATFEIDEKDLEEVSKSLKDDFIEIIL